MVESDSSPVVEEVIASINDVPPGTKKMFELYDRKILVINDNGSLYAINGLCSHYNFPLENGIYANGRIRCPLHGACFNVKTGDIEEYPGFDSLHTFDVRVENDSIILKTTEKILKTGDRRRRVCKKVAKCEDRPIIVIGGGVATATFIEHSRLNGLQTPIVVISEESFTPYDRVLLSKKPAVKGEEIKIRDDEYYKERNVSFKLNTTVTEVLPNKRQVNLLNGESLQYSKLIIATVGKPRKLSIPGSDLKNIFYVRKVHEANEIAEKHVGKHVVCIGASFIGLEMASALAANAASVTVIANSEEPLPMFGVSIGRGYRKRFESKGVKFERNANVIELRGENGDVRAVVLSNGVEVAADLVVVGIGITPATEFLKISGIAVDSRGFITVDEKFRTNKNFIFAIGDVVSFPLPQWNIESINIQHFQTAQTHGQHLGYSIVGKPHPGAIVPYFWSLFFFEFGIKFSGCSHGANGEWYFGDPEELNFVKYYLKDNRVIAVASGGPSKAAVEFAELFKRGITITLDDLKKSEDHVWTSRLIISQ
ncbi:unnamed protein product [Caenorhabditis bovis]|uniref:Rieske domain-containing protein n=1 Tax=Caenorhabditis bovis TaxID=2654633 RepID=A0A8S1EC10_9PELO|nr:unnamed protein product [Caenorhabditis bovis]